jgi:hypothetical protein
LVTSIEITDMQLNNTTIAMLHSPELGYRVIKNDLSDHGESNHGESNHGESNRRFSYTIHWNQGKTTFR